MGAPLNAFFGGYPKDEHDAEVFRLSSRIAELESCLASLEWQPITESNKPKAGWEVCGIDEDGPFVEHILEVEADEPIAKWLEAGYRWTRPITPPAKEKA